MRQMLLPFYHSEDSIRSFLEGVTRKNISLVITDNSSSMLSIKACGSDAKVRLHRMFLSAGNEVLREIGDYIKKRKADTPGIKQFIEENAGVIKRGKPRKIRIRTGGNHRDLREIFQSVNEEYFAGRVTARITWGLKGPRRAARSRTLGSYCCSTHLIRINPILDSRHVPKYFLSYIVYHEMLHADMKDCTKEGRRSVHGKEFKRREKKFKDYQKALEWEKRRWP